MHFASDNTAPTHPAIMAAIIAANDGYPRSYGADPLMDQVRAQIRDTFEAPDAAVYLVATGTAANALAIATHVQPWQAVFAHEDAHIATDECGAPEFFSGAKLALIPGAHGKITPDGLAHALTRTGESGVHGVQRGMLSLTNVTEAGTVYTPSELKDLSETARSLRMSIHMDGARFSNAVASLGCSPADLTWRSGVDVLCFGGTKNGMLATEAAVFFNKDLADAFKRRCKQAGQLASKMRYHAAQWQGMLQSGRWLENAKHANDMAQRLRSQLGAIPGIQVLYPVEANAVFVNFPAGMAEALLEKGWRFYTDVGPGGARLMCSWNTSPEDVDQFASDAKLIQGRARHA